MKNNHFQDPFLNILPTIDVHGETSESVVWLVNKFLNENIKLGKYKVAIIHGIGSGILKRSIHENTKRNKIVSNVYVYPGNAGITIIELKKQCNIKNL